ncbi:MAG: ABC transporter substrate-binding protein, partial [Saprospiraceae bacterium]|nr:ABC transporter substrate-binding protein [Saprospiraceae bacterium]
RGFLSFIKEVEVDPENPRKFSVTVPEPYMLAEVVTCNFNILPKHVYDPDGWLDDVALSELAEEDVANNLAETDSNLAHFAEAFGAVEFNRDIVEGCGPYRLVEWETGQQIVLERKEDWWGDKVVDRPALMHAYPQRIIYRIIPDETTALSALKDGTIDFMAEVSPATFLEMQADSQWADRFAFHSPAVMMYDYLELNNRHPILGDRAVRAALAHAIDYDAIIEAINQGMAQRTVGPFHPDKDYYHDALEPPDFDVEEARALLQAAGWTDTDQDGTVDKILNGQHTELNLDVVVSQRPLGQQIALLVKESAARAGIEIDIITKDNSSWSQAVRQRDFEILPMRRRTSPSINDPYQTWHSESDVPGGGNTTGFRNAEADSLIDLIRTAENSEERNRLYRELQETLYEEQPVIFLYVPLERMIVSKRFDMTPSSRRPGYFENLFKLRGAE